MGFRTGFVLSSVFFLYGVIFISSIYDFPLLYYSPFTQEAMNAAEDYYLSLFNGPGAIRALLHGMVALGLIGLLAKLHRWTDNAKWFDGSSIVCFMASIALYGSVTVPNLRLLADPTNERLISISTLYTSRQKADPNPAASGEPMKEYPGPMTDLEKAEVLRVIAAGNTLLALLLAGVVLMQAACWWTERSERVEAEKRRQKDIKELGIGKKEQ